MALPEESEERGYESIRREAMQTLITGAKSRDRETRLLALFGAGLSLQEELVPLFSEAAQGGDINAQMAALGPFEPAPHLAVAVSGAHGRYS